MATPLKATQKLLVMLEGSPGVYDQPCSIQLGKDFALDATPVEVPGGDCDNPDAPAWVLRAIDQFSSEIAGNGTLHTPDFEQWREWFESGAARNVRIKLDVPGADGGGHYTGEYVLTRIGLGKEGRGFTTFAATMQSNGALTWNPAA